DLSYIRVAAEAIGPVLPSESIVVNKSTVPVGSTRVVELALHRDDVRVVSNPEFLREGSAVHDFLNPDRIVIGAEDQAAAGRVAEEAGYDFGLLRGVIDVNDAQFERVADKVERIVGGSLQACRVAVWGLTFKARTDDLRDSPSLAVIERLLARGASVRAYDPA